MNSNVLPQTATDFDRALKLALQPAAVLETLYPLLSHARPGQHYALEQAKVIAQKANARAVICYHLRDEKSAQTQLLYGKLYSDRARARQVHATMQSLWQGIFHANSDFGVPQPIGIASDSALLFYVPVEGAFLHEFLNQEQSDIWITHTACWLAQLHQEKLSMTSTFQLANEVANLQLWGTLVQERFAAFAPMIQRLLHYLVEVAPKLRLVASIPIHKDFHYQHVVVNGRVSVIDFDEMRMGDPAFDIAHFCAYLQLLAYRTPQSAPRMNQLQAEFIQAYSKQTRWALDDRFVYFFVYTCIKLAKQLCTERGPLPRPTGVEAEREIQFILSKGVEILS